MKRKSPTLHHEIVCFILPTGIFQIGGNQWSHATMLASTFYNPGIDKYERFSRGRTRHHSVPAVNPFKRVATNSVMEKSSRNTSVEEDDVCERDVRMGNLKTR